MRRRMLTVAVATTTKRSRLDRRNVHGCCCTPPGDRSIHIGLSKNNNNNNSNGNMSIHPPRGNVPKLNSRFRTPEHSSIVLTRSTTSKSSSSKSSNSNMTERHPPESSSSSPPPLYQVHGTLPTPCCSGVMVRDNDDNDDSGGSNVSSSPLLQVGQYGQVDWVYTTDMVMNYGRLVGDLNPLHQEWTQGNEPPVIRQSPLVRWISEDEYNDETTNGGNQDVNVTPPRPCTTIPVVHGMLVASLFTGILGTLVPGAIYVNQSLEFRQPVYVGDHVTGRVTVVDIRQRHRHDQDDTKVIVTCDTQVWVTHSPSLSSSSSSSNKEEREQQQHYHQSGNGMGKECIRGQARMLLPKQGVAALENEN